MRKDSATKGRNRGHFGRKGRAALLAAAGAALLLTGCGAGDLSKDAEGLVQDSSFQNENGTSPELNYGLGPEGEELYEMSESGEWESTAQDGEQTQALTDQRKLIRTVHMEVETREYDAFMDALEKKVRALGGYIENMDSYNGSSYSSARTNRSASLVLRIPKNEMDGFLELVSNAGNVIRRTDSERDVTLSYVDLESRRNALRTEQDRLLVLLEEAESLEDIITIEERLAEVRYQLESMESQLRTMDNQVNYGTISLEVSEVVEFTPVVEETSWQRMTDGFVKSLESIGNGAMEILIWLVAHLPYLILLTVCCVLFLLWVKAYWKKSMKKAQAQAERKPHPAGEISQAQTGGAADKDGQ